MCIYKWDFPGRPSQLNSHALEIAPNLKFVVFINTNIWAYVVGENDGLTFSWANFFFALAAKPAIFYLNILHQHGVITGWENKQNPHNITCKV